LASVQAEAQVFGIGIGDFNGDGLADLVLAEDTAGCAIDGGQGPGPCSGAELALGVGSGEFSAAVALPGVEGSPFGGLVVADLNQDGMPDIAANSSDGGQFAVLLNRGDGGFAMGFYPISVYEVVLLPRPGGAPDLVATTDQAIKRGPWFSGSAATAPFRSCLSGWMAASLPASGSGSGTSTGTASPTSRRPIPQRRLGSLLGISPFSPVKATVDSNRL